MGMICPALLGSRYGPGRPELEQFTRTLVGLDKMVNYSVKSSLVAQQNPNALLKGFYMSWEATTNQQVSIGKAPRCTRRVTTHDLCKDRPEPVRLAELFGGSWGDAR